MCVIGVLDSGVGGISTLSSLLTVLPGEQFVYIADRSGCPYGGRSDEFIRARVRGICRRLVGMGAQAIVIACNTATNVCIGELRAELPQIIVGVEPAVKPALAELTTGKALVLVTPAAARQSKFLSLVGGDERAVVCPQPRLAAIIEEGINDLFAVRGAVERELLPLRSSQIESVVLGCTHYCLVRRQIEEIFGAKVYDGNLGTALRLHALLGARGLLSRGSGGVVRFLRV